jgi:DeoR/GlpR family transcriptional regulator of sugar metabolism
MKRNLEAEVSQLVLTGGPKKVTDLALEVGVSGVTIRKVLSSLEGKGVLRRFHGEARAFDSDEIPFRMGDRFQQKTAIAKAAAALVEAGDTILLEAGSTVSILAELLKDMHNLTVITPNLYVARLFRRTKVSVIVLGGLYQEASESFVGSIAKNALAELAFSKAFLGVTGFTRLTGFTLNDALRAEVTQTILARGAKNFILADSSKFGVTHLAPICPGPGLIQTVITDGGLPDEDGAFLEASGITVLKV